MWWLKTVWLIMLISSFLKSPTLGKGHLISVVWASCLPLQINRLEAYTNLNSQQTISAVNGKYFPDELLLRKVVFYLLG